MSAAAELGCFGMFTCPSGWEGDACDHAHATFNSHERPSKNVRVRPMSNPAPVPSRIRHQLKRKAVPIAIEHRARKCLPCSQSTFRRWDRGTGPRSALPAFLARIWGIFSPTIWGSATSTDLPFLAMAFAIVIAGERFDRAVHQVYYWAAIIIVRTAATNSADFLCGDMKLPRVWVIAALTALLAAAVVVSWQLLWRRKPDQAMPPCCVRTWATGSAC